MHRFQRRWAPYLFISPFFIGYAIFFLYPVLWALYLSFFQQIGIGAPAKWVGLGNYFKLLSDDRFIKGVINTTYYAAGSLFIILPAALLLGVVFNMRNLRGATFFRLFYFTPNITSGVVVAAIFGLVFDTRSTGCSTGRSRRWGCPRSLAPGCRVHHAAIIVLGLWRYTGINALYFLAGLQTFLMS